MRPADIVGGMKARQGILRLPNKKWAELAGVDETTLGRVLKGETDPLISTLDRMEDALASEERRVRDCLNELVRISERGKQLDTLGGVR